MTRYSLLTPWHALLSMLIWTLMLALPVVVCVGQTPGSLAFADSKYSDLSYAQALAVYEALLKAGQVPAERKDEVEYRVVVCLGRMKSWDRAFKESLLFVNAHRGTEWEARGIVWVAKLYEDVPHEGYRVGATITRSDGPPKTTDAEKPKHIPLWQSDQRNRLDALEAAHLVYSRLPIELRQNPILLMERIELDNELIATLEGLSRDPFGLHNAFEGTSDKIREWAEAKNWASGQDGIWRIDPNAAYQHSWPVPKKILYLFQHLRQLEEAVPALHGVALFDEAKWLRGYHLAMATVATRSVRGRDILLPYPYRDVRPEPLLDEIVRRYPDSLLAPEARYAAAVGMISDGKPRQALQALQGIIATYPLTDWCSRAKEQASRLTVPEIRILTADDAREAIRTGGTWVGTDGRKVGRKVSRKVSTGQSLAVTRTFSQEEPITATGNQIDVKRRYFRLTPEEIKPVANQTPNASSLPNAQRPTPNASPLFNAPIRPNPFLTAQYDLLDSPADRDADEEKQPEQRYIRTEIKDGDFVSSGDLIEVELLLESANDYDYVLVEDMKPAGCEAVELRSGGDYSPGLYANREMRDTKVAFFLDHLPQGRRLLNYRLRAEVPGLFHSLPTNIFAMYAPTVRALSDEIRMGVRDVEAGTTGH